MTVERKSRPAMYQRRPRIGLDITSAAQPRRGLAIEIDRDSVMTPEDRGWCHRIDRPVERRRHRLRLAAIRHDAHDHARGEDLLHRHRDRGRRHLVEIAEPSLADLLLPAALV